MASFTSLKVALNSSSVIVGPFIRDSCDVGVARVCRILTVSGIREDNISAGS